jgi:hypothetical protein
VCVGRGDAPDLGIVDLASRVKKTVMT